MVRNNPNNSWISDKTFKTALLLYLSTGLEASALIMDNPFKSRRPPALRTTCAFLSPLEAPDLSVGGPLTGGLHIPKFDLRFSPEIGPRGHMGNLAAPRVKEREFGKRRGTLYTYMWQG